MSRIKQKTRAFQTADREFRRKKIALDKEFKLEMNKACANGDMKYFEDLATDYRHYFGESAEITITSFEILYGIIQ